METIKSFWNNLSPWQFMFFVFFLITFFASWVFWIKFRGPKGKKRVIRNRHGRKYLVEGDACYHIPDPQTFNYLGSYFGFSRADSKLMENDKIKRKFTIGKPLPSILSYCQKRKD